MFPIILGTPKDLIAAVFPSNKPYASELPRDTPVSLWNCSLVAPSAVETYTSDIVIA